jgi:hypothetical protein
VRHNRSHRLCRDQISSDPCGAGANSAPNALVPRTPWSQRQSRSSSQSRLTPVRLRSATRNATVGSVSPASQAWYVAARTRISVANSAALKIGRSMFSLYVLRTAARRSPNLARSTLLFDMRRCRSPHRSVAHCREVHLPDVPDPNCTENIEPSKIPPRERPASRCAPSRRNGGSPARRTQLWPTAASRCSGRRAMIALPYVSHARSIRQPASSRATTAANGQHSPRSQRSRTADRGAAQVVFTLSDQYHRVPVVV